MAPDRGLSRRPALRAALAAALLCVGLCGGVLLHLLDRYQETVRPELVSKLAAVGRSVADQVGLTLEVGVPFEAIRGMDAFLAAMAAPNPEIAYVMVADAGGRVLYRRGGGAEQVAPAAARQLDDSRDGMLDVAVPLRADGQLRGSVHVGLGEALLVPWREMVLAAVVAVLGGGAAAWLVLAAHTRRVSRPLARLAAALADPVAVAGRGAGHEHGEMAALVLALDRRRAALEAGRAEALLELEEIALAQPEVDSRRAVRAIAETVAADRGPA